MDPAQPPRASVLRRKFLVIFGEPSASLARRADDVMPGVWGGGPTQPWASRAGEDDKELPAQDTRDTRSAGGLRALLLLTSLLLLLILPLLPTPGLDGIARASALMDLAHLPLAALLVWLLSSLLVRLPGRLFSRRSTSRLLAAGLALAVCGAIESAQALLGTGQASLGDGALDLLGIVCGLLLLQFPPAPTRHRVIIGLLLLALLAWPLARSAAVFRAEAQRFARFPVLASFDDPNELLAWRASDGCRLALSEEFATSGTTSLAISISPTGQRPAALLGDPPPVWSGYGSLALDLLNPGPGALGLHLKITDSISFKDPSERFVQLFNLPEGPSTIRVSLANLLVAGGHRKVDLERINTVVIFFKEPGESRDIYVDSLRLIRER